MLKNAVLLGLLATLCLGLSGCGQKGDLYMPERVSASAIR